MFKKTTGYSRSLFVRMGIIRIVVITNASHGLRNAFAKRWLKEKFRVVNVRRTPFELKCIENMICDICVQEDIGRTVKTIK